MNTTLSSSQKLILFLGAAAAILTGSLFVASTGAHADIASSTSPVISAVVSMPTDTGATVSWTTDQQANTQVMYGQTSTYNASSSLNSAFVTSHTSFLGGLLPNTLYHFQIVSANASGTMATSSDMTFTTASSTAAATTSLPVISMVGATTTDTNATVTWNTDIGSNSQVKYGTTTGYGNISALNPASVLSHLVTLMSLLPSTLYHYQVWSATTSASGVASSTDFTFTTNAPTSTTTPPTGSSTVEMLQAQVNALQTQVNGLLSRLTWIENFLAHLGWGGGMGTTTPPTTGTIDQNGMSINAGGTIDLSGRNFGHEESVKVVLNGATIATAHADGGGNFSTGSIAAPTIAGTYVYHFTGQTSGITANATVTVH